MTVHPDPRDFHDFPPLGTGHRFERASERPIPPRLDLEKGDQVAPTRDEIQLDPADAKAVSKNLPPPALEIPDRLLFAGETPLMSRVAPIRWITMKAAGHGDKLIRTRLAK
jgi:hypothetical protein